MQDRRYHHFNNHLTSQDKMAFVKMLALALALTFTFGLLLSSYAQAKDRDGWEGWPTQSRAERLGTFTYIYGGAGFAAHAGKAQGELAYQGAIGIDAQGDIINANASEDGDDAVFSGGFGIRIPNDWFFEVGLAELNGAYDQPTANGDVNAKPDEPVFEVSVMKGFDLGGPPLLRYTARVGFASIDDPNTDDAAFFGFGMAHEPFRVEYRFYDFDIFESDVLQVSYIYDF